MSNAPTNNGGKPEVKQIQYEPPVGPQGQGHNTVGLGGTNHRPTGGQQGKH